jgi:hypothetical protein
MQQQTPKEKNLDDLLVTGPDLVASLFGVAMVTTKDP